MTPEQYAEQEYHKQVQPPENCPNCQRAHVLEALAYYHRYITTATALVLLIWVRRFLCRHCRISVSCLPQFAQPYRQVNTPTVAAGFSGQDARPEVRRWSQLIKVYWRRFETHLPLLLRQVGNAFGSVPLQPIATDFWRQLLRQWQRSGRGHAPTGPSISHLPVRSITAAINAGSFRLHKGSPRRSAARVSPQTFCIQTGVPDGSSYAYE